MYLYLLVYPDRALIVVATSMEDIEVGDEDSRPDEIYEIGQAHPDLPVGVLLGGPWTQLSLERPLGKVLSLSPVGEQLYERLFKPDQD